MPFHSLLDIARVPTADGQHFHETPLLFSFLFDIALLYFDWIHPTRCFRGYFLFCFDPGVGIFLVIFVMALLALFDLSLQITETRMLLIEEGFSTGCTPDCEFSLST
jgi:hypothetical protein